MQSKSKKPYSHRPRTYSRRLKCSAYLKIPAQATTCILPSTPVKEARHQALLPHLLRLPALHFRFSYLEREFDFQIIDETKFSWHPLNMLQEPQEAIREITRRLINSSHPKKIILFGSYVRGDFNVNSDIDILVIESDVPSRHAEMVRLRRVLRGILFPIDVLVISEEEFKARTASPSNVYYWADKEGKTLYEAA